MLTADIPIDQIDPNPHQPRKRFDGIEELVASIKQHGIISPILVRSAGERFQIIDGERRWRAARLAELVNIPVIIRDVEDQQADVWALVKNLQRQDLTPLEEARAYIHLQKYGYTQEKIGELVGRSQSVIARRIGLLRLPNSVLYFLEVEALPESYFRELLRLEDLRIGQGIPFRLPTTSTRIWKVGNKKPQRFDPQTIYGGEDGPARLLAGLGPEHPNDDHGGPVSRFVDAHDHVREGCIEFLRYARGHNVRWHDLAFFYACAAIQADWSREMLTAQIDLDEQTYQVLKAQWEEEQEEAKAERVTESSSTAVTPALPPPPPPAPASAYFYKSRDRYAKARKALSKLPRDERRHAEALALPRNWNDRIEPKDAKMIAEGLAKRPPEERAQLYHLASSADLLDQMQARAQAGNLPMPPDPRIKELGWAIRSIENSVTNFPNDPLTPQLAKILEDIQAFMTALQQADEQRRTAA